MKRMQWVLLLAIVAVAIVLSCNKSRQETTLTAETMTARRNSTELMQHVIPISQAEEYSRRFMYVRDTVLPAVLTDPSFLSENFDIPFCETFNREAIDALLAVEGTSSVRIYMGVDENGKVRFILLPVDAEGNNIIANLTGESSRKQLGRGQDDGDGDGEGDGDGDIDDGHAIENGYRPPPPRKPL